MKHKPKFAIAALSSMLLLGSMNAAAQAASTSLLGGKTINTALTKALTAAEKKKMIEAEKAKVAKLTRSKPGNVYLLYVSDNTLNGGSEMLYYVNFPTFKKYEDYEKWAAKLKGPVVVEPEGIPEGYAFVKGEIQNPQDKQFESKVKAEGKGKVVYSKKMEWAEAGNIKLEYANGKDNIIFQMQSNILPMKDSKTYSYQSVDSHSAEDRKKYGKILRNQLSWVEKGKTYIISTNPGNPLTKDELIELAKTMIRK